MLVLRRFPDNLQIVFSKQGNAFFKYVKWKLIMQF